MMKDQDKYSSLFLISYKVDRYILLAQYAAMAIAAYTLPIYTSWQGIFPVLLLSTVVFAFLVYCVKYAKGHPVGKESATLRGEFLINADNKIFGFSDITSCFYISYTPELWILATHFCFTLIVLGISSSNAGIVTALVFFACGTVWHTLRSIRSYNLKKKEVVERLEGKL